MSRVPVRAPLYPWTSDTRTNLKVKLLGVSRQQLQSMEPWSIGPGAPAVYSAPQSPASVPRVGPGGHAQLPRCFPRATLGQGDTGLELCPEWLRLLRAPREHRWRPIESSGIWETLSYRAALSVLFVITMAIVIPEGTLSTRT